MKRKGKKDPQEEKINILLYQILIFTTHGKILFIDIKYQLQH